MIRHLQIILSICILLVSSNITYANENNQATIPELEVRFPIIDKVGLLSEEQKESIFDIYSDFECFSFIQISLLIVNSSSDTSGDLFLTGFSGNLKQRIVIRLVTSTKEVRLFWTEALDNSLQKVSKNYRSQFEPYLSDGEFYEAALYGSLKVIKMLSPDYKLP